MIRVEREVIQVEKSETKITYGLDVKNIRNEESARHEISR